MKTFTAKADNIRRKWYVVDADSKNLGRLSAEIAKILIGKHKPEYTPHVDTGDYIVVINAEKIAVTGRKASDKLYHRHTGYIGGLKTANFNWMQKNKPTEILRIAVKGMLPKNVLGRSMLRKLKVFAGNEHQHSAQQPEILDI